MNPNSPNVRWGMAVLKKLLQDNPDGNLPLRRYDLTMYACARDVIDGNLTPDEANKLIKASVWGER